MKFACTRILESSILIGCPLHHYENLKSILKPKNFTELIQSNDYCENECEVNHDGIMSEAQHEACLGKVL